MKKNGENKFKIKNSLVSFASSRHRIWWKIQQKKNGVFLARKIKSENKILKSKKKKITFTQPELLQNINIKTLLSV